MKRHRPMWFVLVFWLCGGLRGVAADGYQSLLFTVDGVERTALIHLPESARTTPAPVVFIFHGHGGTARQVSRDFGMDHVWPEAISVCMQGLDTPGQLTDPQGKRSGWQAATGDQGDRDLKFFDAVFSQLKRDYRVDTNRVYATGHSNGGGFTYLLWLTRGDVFAAVAPSSAVAKYAMQLKPKPVLHIAGETDALVKFAWQQRMIEAVRRVDGCSATGEPWERSCTLYPSKTGTPVVTFIHPGGHGFAAGAPELIVKFFKQHPAPAKR